jgi:hypothetical protein
MALGAANYIAGKTGYVQVGANQTRFGKWKLGIKTAVVKRTNFQSGGFQELLAAITDGSLTISGPYDQGNMALSCGTQYTFVLGWTSEVSITCVAIVDSLDLDDDAEGAADVAFTAKTNGSFTVGIT